jgi:hypothetical protein
MVVAVCYCYPMVDFSNYSITIHDLGSQVFKLVHTLNIIVRHLKNLLAFWSYYFHVLGFFLP